MSPQLNSSTRTTVWHTRNTNLQLLSPGSWLLNMESRKVHWKFLKTKLAANSMSCRISVTFHLLHRLPTTSVLSHRSRLWGPGPSSSFASTEAPAASSASTTSRWPLSAARCIGPVPRSGGRRWRWRRAAPSHMSCFGGFQRISGLKNWEFGHVWSTISNWDMYHCLSKSGSTDWEVTPLPCHTLQTRSKIHNNTLQSQQENH